ATSRAASGSTATRNQIQRTKGLTAFAALPCCAMLLERLTGHPTSGKLRAAFPRPPTNKKREAAMSCCEPPRALVLAVATILVLSFFAASQTQGPAGTKTDGAYYVAYR